MIHSVDQILELCQRIVETHEDKEHLFTSLDALLFDASDESINAVLGGLRLRNIHSLLLLTRAVYEYEREVHLAQAIVDKGDKSPLQNFRSTGWYEEAHDFENKILSRFSPERLMVVGSGAFPTTALSFMSAYPQATVTGVECEEEACILSRGVARVYGYEHLQILQKNALTITDFSNYDCVIVGTIVGVLDIEKKLVVDHFLRHVPASTSLIFRTAVGPGRVIYPTINTDFFGGIKYRVMTNPPQKTFTMILTER